MIRCILWSSVLVLVLSVLIPCYLYWYPMLSGDAGLYSGVESGIGSYKEVESVIRSNFVQLKTGAKLHVLEAGNEKGELIVFIHGFPETGLTSWKYQIPHFAKLGYRVVAPDMRCYNGSTIFNTHDECNSIKSSWDIVELVKHYKKDKAVIIGHDWGAAVAWEIANRNPQVISKLVILTVPHPKIFKEFYKYAPIQLLKSSYFLFFGSPSISTWVFTIHNHYWLRKLLISASPSYTIADLNRIAATWSKPGVVKGMLDYYSFILGKLASNIEYKKIEVPVLILMGLGDQALDYRLGEPSLTMCKNGKIFYIDANHFFQRDAHKETNRRIEDFLK